jgi:serine/threonine protein kinase
MATALNTTPGLVMGTVQYMSPEQVLGREVDHRSDIFSLGVMLYQMATGRLPFAGASVGETIDNVLHAQPQPISVVTGEASGSWSGSCKVFGEGSGGAISVARSSWWPI